MRIKDINNYTIINNYVIIAVAKNNNNQTELQVDIESLYHDLVSIKSDQCDPQNPIGKKTAPTLPSTIIIPPSQKNELPPDAIIPIGYCEIFYLASGMGKGLVGICKDGLMGSIKKEAEKIEKGMKALKVILDKIIEKFSEDPTNPTPIPKPEPNPGIIDPIDDMNAAEQAQMRRYDPLTFDMDGDGIDLISLENSNAFFDLDGDGMQEKVGWIGNDDAILAFDRNDNGKIDNIDELFGKQNNDGTIILGTEELATYDENNDGIIDEQDAIFKQLKLWHDQNENAQTEVGELKTLTEDNITSINIQEISEVNQVVEGNVILSTSTLMPLV